MSLRVTNDAYIFILERLLGFCIFELYDQSNIKYYWSLPNLNIKVCVFFENVQILFLNIFPLLKPN